MNGARRGAAFGRAELCFETGDRRRQFTIRRENDLLFLVTRALARRTRAAGPDVSEGVETTPEIVSRGHRQEATSRKAPRQPIAPQPKSS